jgi:transmembrane sensor
MDQDDRHPRAAVEAAEWVLRLQHQNVARSERAEYLQWLRKSPLHVAEMLRLSEVNSELAAFPLWKEIDPFDAPSAVAPILEFSHRPPGQSSNAELRPAGWLRHWRYIGAIAGPIAVAAIAVAYFGTMQYQTLHTGAAERRQVKLADGSDVSIGPETTLSLRFTEHERRVDLVRGDALFHVAKDRTKPFLVDTDYTRVRAVGTAFGVEHDHDSTIVTVEEGTVAVTQARVQLISSLRTPAEVSLRADQQIVIAPAGSPAYVRKVDSHRELAWADGHLIFEHSPVTEVVRQFNRFNHVQIKVLDSQLAERFVSAVFDAFDPEAFVVFLGSVAKIRVTRPSSNTIVIAPNGSS